MRRIFKAVAIALTASLSSGADAEAPGGDGSHGVSEPAAAALPPPTPEDRKVVDALWTRFRDAGLVGPDAVRTALFKGTGAHTEVLEYFERPIELDGANQLMILKKNYIRQVGREATVASVWNDRDRFLMSVTVMIRRKGFDPEARDWFWIEYEPSGAATYAGKVEHCIACHRAGDEDLRFIPAAE